MNKKERDLTFEVFSLSTDKPVKKTKRYVIKSTHEGNAILGIIYWWGAWRQYVMESTNEIVWSSDCLEELAKFLKKINREQKMKLNPNLTKKPRSLACHPRLRTRKK